MNQSDLLDGELAAQLSRREFLSRAAGAAVGISALTLMNSAPAHSVAPVGMAGRPRAWEGKIRFPFSDYNSYNGNLRLAIPVCSWDSIGDGEANGFNLTLYFNNLPTANGGTLASKWRHSYQSSCAAQTGGILLTKGDGTQLLYTNGSGGTLVPPTGEQDTTLAQQSNGGWIWTQLSGVKFNFDATGRLTAIQDRNNNVTQLSYTSGGLLNRITDAIGRVATFLYSGGVLTRITDYRNNSWDFVINSSGLTITQPPVGSQRFVTIIATDVRSNVSSVQSPDDGTTSFSFDSNSVLQQVTFPNGTIATLVPAMNNSIRSGPGTNFQNNGTLVTQPIDNWPADVVSVGQSVCAGASIYHGYDQYGRLTASQGANVGERIVLAYDAQNNISQRTSSSGAQWNLSSNARGQQLSQTSPSQFGVTYEYDIQGLLSRILESAVAVEERQHDSLGNVSQVTDRRNLQWQISRNSRGQITAVENATIGGAYYTYDSLGNVTRFSLNGAVIQYAYDGDRMTQRTDPLNRVTSYTYDTLGRLSGVDYPTSGAASIRYTFDKQGRHIQVVDATGTTTFQYRTNGGVSSRATTGASLAPNTLTLTNDSSNRLSGLSDSSALAITLGYDTKGRPSRIGSSRLGVTFSVNADGLPNRIQHDDGTLFAQTFDSGQRLAAVNINNRSSSFVRAFTLQYIEPGGVTRLADSVTGAVITRQYNALGKITREQQTGGAFPYLGVYDYDAVGRLTRSQRSQGATLSHDGAYTYDSFGRLAQVSDAATGAVENFTWNATGDLIQWTGPNFLRTFVYDDERRLIQISRIVSGSPQIAVEFGYDAQSNLRWRKHYPSGTLYQYNYSLKGILMSEYSKPISSGGWQIVATYVASPLGIFGRATVQQAYTAHTDPIGGLLFTTDSNSNVVAQHVEDAFGVPRYTPNGAIGREWLPTDEQVTVNLQTGKIQILERYITLS